MSSEVRALVSFERRDLVGEGSPEGSFHLIACRNVLIYFDRATQEALFEKFHDALHPGGYLVLGKVETLLGPIRNRFAPVDDPAGWATHLTRFTWGDPDEVPEPGGAEPRERLRVAQYLGINGLMAEQASSHAGQLSLQNFRFEGALNNMTQGLCMFDARNRLVVWNERFAEMSGTNIVEHAAAQLEGSKAFTKELCRPLQHRVARRMSTTVVDLFEMIQID